MGQIRAKIAAFAAPAGSQTMPVDLAGSLATTVSTYLELMKLRLVALLVLVAVTSAIAAHSGLPSLDKIVLLVLAGGLASAGAGAINHYWERDLDARMERTRARPLPSGRLPARNALWFGIGLIVLSMAPALTLGPVTAAIVLGGAAIYVGAYTMWLKPSSPWSVVVGSLSGTCATWAGWSVGGDVLTWPALWSGVLMFLWSPPHFWCLALARHREYLNAGFPTLSVVSGQRVTYHAIWTGFVVTVASAIGLGWAMEAHLVYWVGAMPLGLALVFGSIRLGADPAQRRAVGLFGLSMTFVALTYITLAIDASKVFR